MLVKTPRFSHLAITFFALAVSASASTPKEQVIYSCAVKISLCVEGQSSEWKGGVEPGLLNSLKAVEDALRPFATDFARLDQLERRAAADDETVVVGAQAGSAVDGRAVQIAFGVSDQI